VGGGRAHIAEFHGVQAQGPEDVADVLGQEAVAPLGGVQVGGEFLRLRILSLKAPMGTQEIFLDLVVGLVAREQPTPERRSAIGIPAHKVKTAAGRGHRVVAPGPQEAFFGGKLALQLLYLGRRQAEHGGSCGQQPAQVVAVVARFAEVPVKTVFDQGVGIAHLVDADVPYGLGQTIEAWGLGIDQLGAAQQLEQAMDQAAGRPAGHGQGHLVNGLFIPQEKDHAAEELLNACMGDPVVGVGQIGFADRQSVQEAAEGTVVFVSNVGQQGAGHPTTDFPPGRRAQRAFFRRKC
jgi:hypothetical protein